MNRIMLICLMALLPQMAEADDVIVGHADHNRGVLGMVVWMPDPWLSLNEILHHTSSPSVKASAAYALAGMTMGPNLSHQAVSVQYLQIFMEQSPRKYFSPGWLYGTAYTHYANILWNLGRKDQSIEVLSEAVEHVNRRDAQAMQSIREDLEVRSKMFFETQELEDRFREVERRLARK